MNAYKLYVRVLNVHCKAPTLNISQKFTLHFLVFYILQFLLIINLLVIQNNVKEIPSLVIIKEIVVKYRISIQIFYLCIFANKSSKFFKKVLFTILHFSASRFPSLIISLGFPYTVFSLTFIEYFINWLVNMHILNINNRHIILHPQTRNRGKIRFFRISKFFKKVFYIYFRIVRHHTKYLNCQ